jgi:hypothetical protein
MFGNQSWSDKRVGIMPSSKSVSYRSEFRLFDATDFDIEKDNPVMGVVKAKWVEATQTYHYKAYGMDDYADTGKKDADQVKNSTLETQVGNITHSVASKIRAGQGLEFESLSPADNKEGCTDSEAKNYNPDAEVDDGSCEYPLAGCTDSEAKNYNPDAEVDDGSCESKTLADNVSEDLSELPWGLIALGGVGIVALKFVMG